MDEKTLEALRGSIAKWEGIVAGTMEDYGTGNCPLCQIFHPFYTHRKETCIGCPVEEATGWPYCANTPYPDFQEAKEDMEFPEEDWSDAVLARLKKEYKGLAQAELDFLKSLLPKKEE